jgi:hypothetical protein
MYLMAIKVNCFLCNEAGGDCSEWFVCHEPRRRFYLKAGLNWIDQQIMGAATSGTPMDGMKTTPIFHDDKVSEDLQRAGYNQYQR